MALVDDLAERTYDIGFEFWIHRQVGFFPVTEHTEAFKILSLSINLLARIFTAFLAEGFGIDLVTRLADFLFYLQFNRQTMTVPAGNIACIETIQCA